MKKQFKVGFAAGDWILDIFYSQSYGVIGSAVGFGPTGPRSNRGRTAIFYLHFVILNSKNPQLSTMINIFDKVLFFEQLNNPK